MRCSLLLFCLLLVSGVDAAEAPLVVKGATTVNAIQARQLHELGGLFIDVRPAREWAWGHVHGALHLELNGHFATLAEPAWPRSMPIVLYCDSEVCPHSAQAAQRAVGWGFQQVYYFRSGYFAWQLLDFPLGKGRENAMLALIPEGR